MARIPRLMLKSEEGIYHVMSRTALDGYVLGDVEKDYLFGLIKRFGGIFFAEIFGYCIMGNHFHLLVKMKQAAGYTDEDVKSRIGLYNSDKDKVVTDGEVPYFRDKFSNLSEFIREIKQRFSRFYNKRHKRIGYFWGNRFKSVIVEKGDTLINLLAYIDLNPLRAGLVDRPENYRWCSIGYHAQAGNRDGLLSTDFGLVGYDGMSERERFADYREFLYETGAIETEKGKPIDEEIVQKERAVRYELSDVDKFRHKTRYFTDSGIIGTKAFVSRYYEQFKDYFNTKKTKKPKKISGCAEIYSLKNLSN